MKSYSVFFANYTIGEDAYDMVPQVCRRYGTRILMIGGEKAMDAAAPLLEAALKDTDLSIVDRVIFGKDCTTPPDCPLGGVREGVRRRYDFRNGRRKGAGYGEGSR